MPKRKTKDRKKCDKANTQYHQRASLRGQMFRASEFSVYQALRKKLKAVE